MANTDPKNPYVAGPPITDLDHFYGRQDIIKTVVGTLTTSPQNIIVLHGQRRIGKTSLLHRLRCDETLRQNYLPLFFDLSLHKNKSLAYILADLARTIARELELSVSPPLEADLVNDIDQFQRSFLSEVYRHLGQKRMLFLCDEFDVAVPTATGAELAPAADTFLGYVHNLIEAKQQPLAYVFVVGQRLDLLAEGYQRLFKTAITQPVRRLKQEDTYDLLIEQGKQGNISYTQDALDTFWSLASGHPYLTQLIGSEIFDRLRKQRTQKASATDVAACLDKAMEHGEGGLNWFWGGFSLKDQWVLSAIADLTDRQMSITDAEIDETLSQNLLNVSSKARENIYMQLLHGDFLVDTGETKGRYRFAVEFIRRWIVKYHPVQEFKRQMEEVSAEARHFYGLGLSNFERGISDEAVKYYRLAIQHEPKFALAHLALAPALVAIGQNEEAIAEYEQAFKLDSENARDELIERRLSYAREIEANGDIETALKHIKRVLEIDPGHNQARRHFSDIYLRQARKHLEGGRLTEALDAIQNLADPWPLLQDPVIRQRVDDLWLDHSQKLIQQKPPNWEEAQHVLDGLEILGKLPEAVRLTYNKITFDKALAFLAQDDLDQTLGVLQKELKPPLPSEPRDTLLAYGRQQAKQGNWPQAEEALKGSDELFDDKDSKKALIDLNLNKGDYFMSVGETDKAIESYRQAEIWQNKL